MHPGTLLAVGCLAVIRALAAQAPVHWAYVAPVRPRVEHGVHPVDELVRRRLEDRGWAMAPRAARDDLVRRLRFDLTGLPPDEGDRRFLGPAPDDARLAQWIDRLLASPAHAERLAMWWLDAARYADTDGFQQDAPRANWPWRDWVVEAFAANMPFDRFTELQFAGDLLEDAAPEDVLATCFHRNHMHNGEGGRDPEESRVDYVRDRVNTVGAVWLGATLECAQCHDHKFDPVSQADYYSLSAYFDSIDEDGRAGGGAKPFLEIRSDRAEPALVRATEDRDRARGDEQRLRRVHRPGFERWLDDAVARGGDPDDGWHELAVARARSLEGGRLSVESEGVVVRSGAEVAKEEYLLDLEPGRLRRVSGLALDILADPGRTGGPGAGFADAADGEFVLTGVKIGVMGSDGTRRSGRWAHAVANAEGKGADALVKGVGGAINDDPRTGWTTRGALEGGPARAVFGLEQALDVAPGDRLEVRLLFRSNVDGAYARRFRLRATAELGDAARGLGATPGEVLREVVDTGAGDAVIDEDLRKRLFARFLDEDPAWRAARRRTRRLDAQVASAERAQKPQRVTVLRQRPEPRSTRVLLRGVWDQRGDEVGPGTPKAFGESAGPTRLDLARWLTDARHPLTSRVIANHVWQLLWGRGLVGTPADFGLQGERPVHGELLDWLAVELVESGWDLRHLIRTIVTSEVYMQASRTSPRMRELDPDNHWLARSRRFRLPSWMIRDAALAASGLLDARVGGPPVRPWQPPGVWEEMFMGRMRYEPTVGAARHRRSIYVFWRRNIAPTFFFDHADRRTCAVGVRRTNTPLQALIVLNDRTFATAARALAARAMAQAQRGLGWAFERVVGRAASAAELGVLEEVLRGARAHYLADPQAASLAVAPPALDVGVMSGDVNAVDDPVAWAAWTATVAVMFNLDEALSRP